ncbi:hypothetical protein BGX33_008380 [Mortierella sp. NVP41]|nr:hypothetical protein BGX33_008380 [Mortierella sp. NVP41]
MFDVGQANGELSPEGKALCNAELVILEDLGIMAVADEICEPHRAVETPNDPLPLLKDLDDSPKKRSATACQSRKQTSF